MPSSHAKSLKLVILIMFIALRTSSSARLGPTKETFEASFVDWQNMKVLHVLVRGRIPPSGPSNRGHASSPFFIKRHLLALDSRVDDRELLSVPSPGVGH
ncbi:hypothetical protein IHE45_05G099300 [Dioscorea alata]|uniref:Uncharacterized protein n=1 Tax=Dioscorea alata TaxID=55571 RepID=A0ACB7W338_DIOAL|nr:hypothetical protein IHE45_05G099300 [Dioscorea alata]